MSLLLDERRQAMLLEMGIRSFGLEPALAAVGEVQRPVAKPLAQPTALQAADVGVGMRWRRLFRNAAAVRCAMGGATRCSVPATGRRTG
jgi:hypothetical protein